MQVKVEKQTTVVLSLTELEASQLRAVLAQFARGEVEITDSIYDSLTSVDVETDDATFEAAEDYLQRKHNG